MSKRIITISREFGSSGREIGKRVAEALDIPFYDNELITIAAQKSGYSEELFRDADLHPTGSLLFSLSLYGTGGATFDLPLNDKVFLAQSEIIRDVADQGSCVIVGRCANYVLEDTNQCLNVFIHADNFTRVDYACKENGLPKNKAKEMVQKIDKRRSTYYNYYTGKKWGDMNDFDLCIDSGRIPVDTCIEIIVEAYKGLK